MQNSTFPALLTPFIAFITPEPSSSISPFSSSAELFSELTSFACSSGGAAGLRMGLRRRARRGGHVAITHRE